MKPIFIYALVCPITGGTRYIGKTQIPDRRLNAHIAKARTGQTNHHCARWIRQLLAKDLRPTFEIIFEVPQDEEWQKHE
jgi:predicted GIY-YIG superfamily endonuclease